MDFAPSLTLLGVPPLGKVVVWCDVPLFAPAVVLVTNWLRTAGLSVTETVPPAFASASASASADVVVVAITLGSSRAVAAMNGHPYIAVLTEQVCNPMYINASNRAWVTGAHAVWAMDAPDAHHVVARYGVPAERVAVVPAMLGTYFATIPIPTEGRAMAHAPKQAHFLMIGSRNARRQSLMRSIGSAAHMVHDVHGTTLEMVVSGADKHVVANFYPEPCMYTLHRLGMLFAHAVPTAVVVVESCPHSTYSQWLLDVAYPAVVTVPYADIVATATRPITPEEVVHVVGARARFAAAMHALWQWNFLETPSWQVHVAAALAHVPDTGPDLDPRPDLRLNAFLKQ